MLYGWCHFEVNFSSLLCFPSPPLILLNSSLIIIGIDGKAEQKIWWDQRRRLIMTRHCRLLFWKIWTKMFASAGYWTWLCFLLIALLQTWNKVTLVAPHGLVYYVLIPWGYMSRKLVQTPNLFNMALWRLPPSYASNIYLPSCKDYNTCHWYC